MVSNKCRLTIVAAPGTALAETVAQNANPASYIGGWGGDFSISPNATTYPWFRRGGDAINGAAAGVFAIGWYTGATSSIFGWRAVGYEKRARERRASQIVGKLT